jgi:CRISPR-associated protein Csb2
VLALGIRYLNGFVAASQPDDRNRVEWPPHPGRVFMALAAAYFQTGEAAEEREALLWLEALNAAPFIKAPEVIQRAVVTHYVPVNDKAGPSKAILQSAPLTRERQPRTFARGWLEQDTAFLVWPDVNVDELMRASLEALCAKVTRIGHSSSLVQMWLASPEEVGESNWVPDDDRAVEQLRLPTPGTLAYLERRYNREAVESFATLKVAEADDSDKKLQRAAKKRLKEEFSDEPPPRLRPELTISQGYAPPAPPKSSDQVVGSVFSPHLLIFRLEPERAPYRWLDLPSVLVLTQRWHEALVSRTNDLPDRVRSILSGRAPTGAPMETPHLAFLPLAFVGQHEQADGHLLGMALALPNDLSRGDRRGALVGIGRVTQLLLGRLGTWRVRPKVSVSPTLNLRPEVWTAYVPDVTHRPGIIPNADAPSENHPSKPGARCWSSVTPVVYDRHPKTKDKVAYQAEVAEMIRQSCTSIGLPAPREVIITPVSTHLGVPPSHVFPRLRRKDDSERRHTHAILIFEQPVCGPVAIGAGRYRGYGFFRPVAESL